MEWSAGSAPADPESAKSSTESTCRCRIIRFNTESIYRGAKRPCRRGRRPRPMLSVLNLMILRLDVDSVEDFADFGSAGASPG